MHRLAISISLILLATATAAAAAARVTIASTSAPITIDGELTDAGWQQASRFDTWYETNPRDNVEPKVKTVGWVTYDRKFLYIGIEASDPNPSDIRAVYGDRDQMSGNSDDFVGVLLDTRNDGKTGMEFFVSARGVQYDAVLNDAGSGEDPAPDFFWDSAAKIHSTGWTAELRIPFSSLRYDNPNPDEWGLILYRNLPRDRRYQIFTSKLPRGMNCFVCNFGKVTGFRDLPAGDHLVVAPYITAQQLGQTRSGLGSPLVNEQVGADGGLDVKWNPTADMAIDATINPDFSQVESDVAVISTNERFAIFLPEKRPFFLEGLEMFSTPIQAVYTRTLTAPRWGARTTGKSGDYAYTLLLAQDRGGGSVILPSAFGSRFAAQDFSSMAMIGRVRRDFGRSFVSVLATTRESAGGAHNRVFGPDFLWRINDAHAVTGQLLYSSSETPERPDLAPEWDGRELSGHAVKTYYTYRNPRYDFYANYSDFGDGFRADNGFVPQIGWRGSYVEGGRTWRPTGFFSRLRGYSFAERQQTQDGDALYRNVSAGVSGDGRYRSFVNLRLEHATVSNAGTLHDTNRLWYTVQFAVSRVLSFVSMNGWIGEQVDFANDRLGRGSSISSSATIRPSAHLQLALFANVQWLSIAGDRLFTSQVERLRATYSFNSRTFLRAIVQNQRTNRDRDLYDNPVSQHSGALATQLLFAYKLNWQTVFYVGGGNLEEVTANEGELVPSSRHFFAKVSYAFQR